MTAKVHRKCLNFNIHSNCYKLTNCPVKPWDDACQQYGCQQYGCKNVLPS